VCRDRNMPVLYSIFVLDLRIIRREEHKPKMR
jgi:hypothetical protein